MTTARTVRYRLESGIFQNWIILASTKYEVMMIYEARKIFKVEIISFVFFRFSWFWMRMSTFRSAFFTVTSWSTPHLGLTYLIWPLPFTGQLTLWVISKKDIGGVKREDDNQNETKNSPTKEYFQKWFFKVRSFAVVCFVRHSARYLVLGLKIEICNGHVHLEDNRLTVVFNCFSLKWSVAACYQKRWIAKQHQQRNIFFHSIIHKSHLFLDNFTGRVLFTVQYFLWQPLA